MSGDYKPILPRILPKKQENLKAFEEVSKIIKGVVLKDNNTKLPSFVKHKEKDNEK